MKHDVKRYACGRASRSQITRQIMVQYVITLTVFLLTLALSVFLAWQISAQITWRADNPLYWILRFIKDTLFVWLGAAALAGWIFITYYFMQKPLRYLDELVVAAQRLATPGSEPVALSPALRDTQNELNLVREQALRDAQNAREAEQRKNDLIVYLAHDLKTPLTSTIGYLTLLRDEPQLSGELRAKYTDIALRKAERLEDLINEFFDITRFSLTHLTLEEESVNLTRLLEQVAFEFAPILAEKSVSFDLRLCPDVQFVCDPDKLQRVFDNLFRNAVHYSYPDTSILVALEQRADRVVVRVQNAGKTIPPEKLGRIFEQFFRLDAARDSSTGGAGLGLAIAKEIVELHGGAIRAESADESITFTVTLPLSRQKIV